MDTVQEEQHDVSDPADAIDADSVTTSSDAHLDGTIKGGINTIQMVSNFYLGWT